MTHPEVVGLKPEEVAYGPVPSRRLGRSLGVNNIPPKICSYSCIYCQLGRTSNMRVSRQTFYEPQELVKRVQEKVESARKVGESIDYLTLCQTASRRWTSTLDVRLSF
jgi:wyosine [tRNA(Phe)-imidazoG37] synthetase (radical SAM superfamily)